MLRHGSQLGWRPLELAGVQFSYRQRCLRPRGEFRKRLLGQILHSIAAALFQLLRVRPRRRSKNARYPFCGAGFKPVELVLESTRTHRLEACATEATGHIGERLSLED